MTTCKIAGLALPLILLTTSASAATLLSPNGNIQTAANWSNGLPSSSNVGTINQNATSNTTVFGFGTGSIVNLTAGNIVVADGFNVTSGTWNISGGTFNPRYFLSNGSSTVINLSGGVITLKPTSTNFVSTGNGGTLNISGSAIINAATNAAQNMSAPGGTINFANDWTGTWSVGSFSGNAWRNLFTSDTDMKFNGANISGATFDSKFNVSANGQTLSLIPVPEPSTMVMTVMGAIGVGVVVRLRRNRAKRGNVQKVSRG